MEEKDSIYVVGAGVSGLVAAYELEMAGYKPIIIEQSDNVGGRVKSVYKNGFNLDIGFQVLLSAYPMANKYLDFKALQLRQLESGALIYSGNQMYKIGDPLRNWSLLFPTLFADIGNISDKLRILKLNNKLKKKSLNSIFESSETSTLDYLIDFGFSKKIIERFFKPFFAGIFLEPDLRTSSRMFEFVYKMFGAGYATIPKLGIGEISNQLKSKLKGTEFIFNTEVIEVTNNDILLSSGEKFTHNGVILANNKPSLIPDMNLKNEYWKSCMCLYFEVDKTNIPTETIALISDKGNVSNNYYAYTDHISGKQVLSVTGLRFNDKTDQEMIDLVTKEVKKYTKASIVKYIHHFKIKQALPDMNDIKSSIPGDNIQMSDNVFVAGDSVLNGSLNAAMESGYIAAKTLIDDRKN